MALPGLVARLPTGVRRFLKAMPGAGALRDRLYQNPQGSRFASAEPRPVVYLPTWLEWEVMRQRPQYLLEALARAGHQVFFVDPRSRGASSPMPGVSVVPTLGPTPRSGVILYTHFAPTRTLVDRYSDGVVVYDLLDDLSIYDPDEVGMPVERTVRHHHGPLISRADVVIASSTVLVERHRGERPDILLVENGVDPTLFTVEGPRVDLGEGPIVGYHGAIAAWFDFALLEEVARIRPEYRVVLVGPVLEEAKGRLESLTSLPNVIHHPGRPAAEVAAFVRSFDVGVIPFVVDEMTRGVTPLKLYEFLASGVPVVSTPLPACVAHPEVAVAAEPARFAGLLDQALNLDATDRDRLRSSGEAASWDRRVEPLLERLDILGLRRVP